MNLQFYPNLHLVTQTTQVEVVLGVVVGGKMTEEELASFLGLEALDLLHRGKITDMGLSFMPLVMMNALFLNSSFQRVKKHYQGKS